MIGGSRLVETTVVSGGLSSQGDVGIYFICRWYGVACASQYLQKKSVLNGVWRHSFMSVTLKFEIACDMNTLIYKVRILFLCDDVIFSVFFFYSPFLLSCCFEDTQVRLTSRLSCAFSYTTKTTRYQLLPQL